MQSKRKSPFAGNTVSLTPGGGNILYSRYVEPTEVVEDPPSPRGPEKEKSEKKRKVKEAATAAAVSVKAEPDVLAFGGGAVADKEEKAAPASDPMEEEPPAAPTTRKKARWTDDKKDAAKKARLEAAGIDPADVDAVAAAAAAVKAEKRETKEKKRKERAEKLALRKLAPEERISGPGNADEAAKMRDTMGLTSGAGVPGFSFGFDGNSAPAAAPQQAEVQQEPAKQHVADSSDTSSDSDSEQQKPALSSSSEDSDGGVKKEEPSSSDATSGSSGSDSDTSSSSSSDSDSSSSSDSDSDDDEKKPTTVAAATAPAAAADSGLPDPDFVPRRVYIGGMPYSFHEGQVREFWEYCGAIESLDMLTFPDTGRFRGIVFITFATEEGYKAALGCDGEACEGQTVKVQRCRWSAKDRRGHLEPPPQQAQQQQQEAHYEAMPPPSGTNGYENPAFAAAPPAAAAVPAPLVARPPAPKTTGYDVAYVGNIAYEADEAALRALFEPFGMTKVRLHTDKDTGRPKGYAHVHFKDEASLDSAMVLNGTPLMGRKIRVGYAQPKKE